MFFLREEIKENAVALNQILFPTTRVDLDTYNKAIARIKSKGPILFNLSDDPLVNNKDIMSDNRFNLLNYIAKII